MINEVAQAVNEFKDKVILNNRDEVEEIILYGSVVNGRYQKKNSDIDIMILAKDKSIDEDVLDVETEVSLKYGVVILALVATRHELEEAKLAGYLYPMEVLKGEIIYERH